MSTKSLDIRLALTDSAICYLASIRFSPAHEIAGRPNEHRCSFMVFRPIAAMTLDVLLVLVTLGMNHNYT